MGVLGQLRCLGKSPANFSHFFHGKVALNVNMNTNPCQLTRTFLSCQNSLLATLFYNGRLPPPYLQGEQWTPAAKLISLFTKLTDPRSILFFLFTTLQDTSVAQVPNVSYEQHPTKVQRQKQHTPPP